MEATPQDRMVRLAARELSDPVRLAGILRAHTRLYPGSPPPVVATLWWYLASAVLVEPPAAGALAGVPRSGALDDLEVSLDAAGVVSSAVSHAPGPADPGPGLGSSLAAVIETIGALTGLRPRPLWAVAVDSLANRLLALGRARREVDRATALAQELTGSMKAPVPPPRFVDVDGARFVVRMSCCALYRTAGGELCTSCPRRTSEDRAALLLRAAPGFR